jgi:hypothetical protein
MNRTDTRARVRRVCRRIERRVFDRVAHADDPRLAEGLDVEESAAMLEPEFSVHRVVHLVVHVHVLVDETDVELECLHDGGNVITFDPHEAPHAVRVHRARSHPQIDRDLVEIVEGSAGDECLRQRRLVREHAQQHVFVHDGQQLFAVSISGGLRHDCILPLTP